MWHIDQLGQATFLDSTATPLASVSARGRQAGVHLGVHAGSQATSLAVTDVTGEPLPAVGDSYVRGNDFIARLAQGENDAFGLTLQATLVETEARSTVLECVAEMQTRLLDSHPEIEFAVAAESIETLAPGSELVTCEGQYLSVLRTPRDQAASRTLPPDSGIYRLRIFGDFLEKGVIRKARPWIVIDSATEAGAEHDRELRRCWEALRRTPLPLMA